jgi:hypothetical protein
MMQTEHVCVYHTGKTERERYTGYIQHVEEKGRIKRESSACLFVYFFINLFISIVYTHRVPMAC